MCKEFGTDVIKRICHFLISIVKQHIRFYSPVSKFKIVKYVLVKFYDIIGSCPKKTLLILKHYFHKVSHLSLCSTAKESPVVR